jgi:two-component system, NarL family, nitrate/nitrite response regulator NarL
MSRQRLEFDRLTPREEEVLSALMRGAKARDICVQSFVSMPTVRSQIRSILTKLGVTSQLAAVALAYQSGWSGPRGRQPNAALAVVVGAGQRASA